MDISHQINDVAGLAELYREPAGLARDKVFSRIDEASAEFIDRCPFLVLSTSSDTGSIDASPRGGPSGFIQRLDDRHIAIPDLNGNNRLDSLRNIVERPSVGLLLVMPGKDETLRINGPAVLTTAPEILDGFTAELRRPKSAIVVETAELYGHCAKAFRRGNVWDTDAWKALEEAPGIVEVLSTQFEIDLGPPDLLEASYAEDLAAD